MPRFNPNAISSPETPASLRPASETQLRVAVAEQLPQSLRLSAEAKRYVAYFAGKQACRSWRLRA
jgi:hypothetical protein